MSCPVKYFHSAMQGAPQLPGAGAAGSLIAVLDACLLNGFNTVAIASATIGADGTMTIQCASSPNYEVDQVVSISGCNVVAVNDEWRVVSVLSTTSFTIKTSLPAQSLSGAMSVKAAPIGWVKKFSGTNKAVYGQPATAVGASGNLLRVDDTSTSAAIVRGFERMDTVDLGYNPFPNYSQVPTSSEMSSGNACVWIKTSTNVSGISTRKWWLIGDSRLFYLGIEWASGQSVTYVDNFSLCVFGDPASVASTDKFNTLLQACSSTANTYPGGNWPLKYLGSGWSATSYGNMTFCRPSTVLGAPPTGKLLAMGPGGPLNYNGTIPYPNPGTNTVHFNYPVYLQEYSSGALRGYYPGMYYHCHVTSSSGYSWGLAPHLAKFSNIAGLAGKTIITLNVSDGGTLLNAFFDITGPWR